MALLPEWSSIAVPVVGMLHAPALPGAAHYQGNFSFVRQFVLRDAESLCAGGVDGLMLENYGDTPFFPDRVPAITIAAITALATEVRQRFNIPLGINVLRNDGRSAMAVAVACGAAFIRVNVLCGARVTDQGILQGIAHDVLRDRVALGGSAVRILADVDVKHSAPVAARPLSAEVRDLIDRAHADGIIVSGDATGSPADFRTVAAAAKESLPSPVFVGSGVNIANAAGLIHAGAAGLIVGSSLKRDGDVSNPVDEQRVRQLVAEVRRHASAA